MNLFKKSEKGSTTIFVLTAMLLFLVVIVGVFVLYSNKVSDQQRVITRIQNEYSTDNIDEVYNNETKEETYPPTVVTKNFSIDGVIYKFEPGMTFSEWVVSEYNTGGFMMPGSSYLVTSTYQSVRDPNGSLLFYSTLVTENMNYST